MPAIAPPPLSRHLLGVGAALWTAFFFAALHPVSGWLGGIAFLLTAWVIPSFVNIMLTLWCVSCLPLTALPARIAAGVAISAILGLNTALPRLLDPALYAPDVTTHIERARPLAATARSTLWFRQNPFVPVEPFAPRISVSGDEGCMCMYFTRDPSDGYVDQVSVSLHEVTGSIGGMTNFAVLGDQARRGIVNIDLRLVPSAERPGTVDALMDVYDGTDRIAWFVQRAIPYHDDVRDRAERSAGLLNGHFIANGADMLLHGSFWRPVMRTLGATYFPTIAMRRFLAEALPRAPADAVK